MRPTEASWNSTVATRSANKGLLYPCSPTFVASGGVEVPVTHGVTSTVLAMIAYVGYNQSLCPCAQVASIRARAYRV